MLHSENSWQYIVTDGRNPCRCCKNHVGLSHLENKPLNEVYAFYQFIEFLDQKVKTDIFLCLQRYTFYTINQTSDKFLISVWYEKTNTTTFKREFKNASIYLPFTLLGDENIKTKKPQWSLPLRDAWPTQSTWFTANEQTVGMLPQWHGDSSLSEWSIVKPLTLWAWQWKRLLEPPEHSYCSACHTPFKTLNPTSA